jgi:hypothetical protein
MTIAEQRVRAALHQWDVKCTGVAVDRERRQVLIDFPADTSVQFDVLLFVGRALKSLEVAIAAVTTLGDARPYVSARVYGVPPELFAEAPK